MSEFTGCWQRHRTSALVSRALPSHVHGPRGILIPDRGAALLRTPPPRNAPEHTQPKGPGKDRPGREIGEIGWDYESLNWWLFFRGCCVGSPPRPLRTLTREVGYSRTCLKRLLPAPSARLSMGPRHGRLGFEISPGCDAVRLTIRRLSRQAVQNQNHTSEQEQRERDNPHREVAKVAALTQPTARCGPVNAHGT